MNKINIAFFSVFALMVSGAAISEVPGSLRKSVAEMPAPAEGREALANAVDAATRAGVNGDDLQAILKQAGTYNYTALDTASMINSLTLTRRDGLPVGLVRDKILEGMAKQVPGALIRDVSVRWSEALKNTRLNLRALEERGLKYSGSGELEALTNLGASFAQRHRAPAALTSLASAGMSGGKVATGASNLLAAGMLAELLLVHGATVEQALEVPQVALRNGSSPEQLQALQRRAIDLLRQGMAPLDLIVTMRRGQAAAGSFATDPKGPAPFSAPFSGSGVPAAHSGFPGAVTIPGAPIAAPGTAGFPSSQGFPAGGHHPPGGVSFPRQ